MGEGKAWAKGKTAASAHRGMRYERRMPLDHDRRTSRAGRPAGRALPLEWSDTMAYVVGLLATDGCLINDRRHVNFKSEDRQLVETFLECLGRSTASVQHAVRRENGKVHYFAQFSDVLLYRWLEGIGLMPRKSLVLGALDVPDDHLLACARGLLDGDGSLLNHSYAGGGKAAGKRYEAFTTRFISASREHIAWLRDRLQRNLGVHGWVSPPSGGRGCWAISYGIRESCTLLPRMYVNEHVPKLERKWAIWRGYAERHEYPPTHESSWTAGHRALPGERDRYGRYRSLWVREGPVAVAV